MDGSPDSTERTRPEQPNEAPTRNWLLPRAVLKALTLLALAVAVFVGLLDGFVADHLRSARNRSRSD